MGSAATSRDLPFLVALEGIDGAGKATQAELLREHLAGTGRSVSVRSYPVYRSFFGTAIRRMLDGVEGPSAAEVDPRSMALWYALDRRDDLRDQPLGGDVVVLNRFTLSNAVYQAARIEADSDEVDDDAPDGADRAAEADAVFRWVLELEQQHLGLPEPDLTVVLDVPPELSYQRADARSRRDRSGGSDHPGASDDPGSSTGPDVYERAGGLLAAARARYLWAVEELDAVVMVPCLDDDHGRPVEAVHADVRAQVGPRIGKENDPNVRSDVVSRG